MPCPFYNLPFFINYIIKNNGATSLTIADNRAYPYRIKFGKYLFIPACSSPYPAQETINSIIYVCSKCFSYFSSKRIHDVHLSLCKMKNPPGRVVYKENDLKIYEVKGVDQLEYCHQLCLFSRAFLDHKTAYNNCQTFLFYILMRTVQPEDDQ